MISTHTPLAGRDWVTVTVFWSMEYFYSHAPRGARLNAEEAWSLVRISTHTPLAGRDCAINRRLNGVRISTHTPLAGRDEYHLEAYRYS